MKKTKNIKDSWWEQCPYCWKFKTECKTWFWDEEDPMQQCWPQTDQEKYEDFINNQRKYG